MKSLDQRATVHNWPMNPTGLLRRTADGVDLELTRTIAANREDVWASLTESERTALWFGPWEQLPGNMIRVQMAFEEGAPWSEMRIDACEAPTRLAVSMIDDAGSWNMEVLLSESQGATIVTLIQHLSDTEGIGEIGPGWEYYLDMLVNSRNEEPLPTFDDYYPAQAEYYSSLSPR
ncbi:SRPBCC family protein [Rhodococcus sp. H36-A4]|uniref:SRPBCC family protein n=1 Tax=Rhodococcus sp. H36-A4 TaxID=3004353 RepID=UPI0022AEDE0A|nr:SRPBCC family protein [Rhodococcus sp. H36-A4]MCZ4077241.1 SRPBCC family protein [Rhodococcus sp. H36-A4]